MTREEEIKKASSDQASKFWFPCRPDVLEDIREDISEAFEAGVQWSDRHPASPETAGAQAIDWEQRRYDIVKGILVRFITHGDYEVRNEWYRMKTQYIRDAIEDADTIIEELRKTEQR